MDLGGKEGDGGYWKLETKDHLVIHLLVFLIFKGSAFKWTAGVENKTLPYLIMSSADSPAQRLRIQIQLYRTTADTGRPRCAVSLSASNLVRYDAVVKCLSMPLFLNVASSSQRCCAREKCIKLYERPSSDRLGRSHSRAADPLSGVLVYRSI